MTNAAEIRDRGRALRLAWLVVVICTASTWLRAATFTVTSLASSGIGTLQWALTNANALPDLDTIEFNIPGPGPHTIQPGSPLPTIVFSVSIDGYTQPGANSNTLAVGNNAVIKIRLSGMSAGVGAAGLRVNSANCLIRGLAIIDFDGHGIYVVGQSNLRVQGNFIGLDVDGVTVRANGGAGIHVTGNTSIIGGADPSERNQISGNLGGGISLLNSLNNRVQGNYIGTDISGTIAKGNRGPAIALQGVTTVSNLIGGTNPAELNLIAASTGPSGHGIYLMNCSSNRIEGNFIGTDWTGTNALGHAGAGVYADPSMNNVIGGTTVGVGNTIAFSAGPGVWAMGGTNTVLGNSIFSNSGLGIDLGSAGPAGVDPGDTDGGPNNQQNFPELNSATTIGPMTAVQGTLRSWPSTTYRVEFFASPVAHVSGYGEGQVFLGATDVISDAAGSATIDIGLTTQDLTGQYVTATATDPFGNTSEFSLAQLVFRAGPPSIVSAPQDVLVSHFGQTNFLTVVADGTPPLYYQWSFGGVPLPGETNSTLWFPGLQPSDLGVYSVVVSNSSGVAGPLFVTLQVAPESGLLVVDNLGDSGPGTLRQAILDANSIPDPSTIVFGFVGPGPFTISLVQSLPDITSPVVIDGASVSGYSGRPMVELDGWGIAADGLVIVAGNSVVRGLAIGNFGGSGIRLEHGGTNRIEANFLGLRADGGTGFPNQQHGLLVVSSSTNRIGGNTVAGRNVISANFGDGIHLDGEDATHNVIQGNFLGTDAAGTQPLGNGGSGVEVVLATNNFVGGTGPNEGNWIAFNGRNGVGVLSGSCAILGNVIVANAALAVDLADDGPTPDDPGDYDAGANALQNTPEILSANYSPSGTTLWGWLHSTPDTAFHIEFFAGTECGHARVFLGAADIISDPFGDALFSTNFLAGDLGGWFVVATATDPLGNTSELSPCKRVAVPPYIASPPADQTVHVNDPATFSVVAAGAQPLHYQWMHEGEAIPGATNDTLTLTAVVASDAGDYTVAVSNQDGAVVSTTARLSVLVPTLPVFTAQPQSQTVPPGGTVVFSVGFSGVGPFAVQWRLNGVNIYGATNATLILNGVQITNSGTYSVVVSTDAGAVNSANAVLTVEAPALAMNDTFGVQGMVNTLSGIGRSSNTLATAQSGEPMPGGKPGGKSMWLTWKAPKTGIVTFTTVGSTFDTLLAVYTGHTLTNLVEVVSDDDSGGYLTSTVTFNAVNAVQYKILVDGFGGASGDIVLSWGLEQTSQTVPVIVAHPNHQIVAEGGTALFTVGALGTGLTYQWFFNDQPIAGAITDQFIVPSVSRMDVGNYFVRVSNGLRTARSRLAHIEIGFNDAGTQRSSSRDKFLDSALAPDRLVLGEPEAAVALQFRRSSGGSSPVSRGYIGTQVFSTYGATKELGEPNHCGIAGGASEWFVFVTTTNGLFCLNTEGSTFDTVLAVYTGPGTSFETLVAVACDNNSGADGRTSKVMIPAEANTSYFVAVDGVAGVTGTVVLNYLLGTPPVILTNPVSRAVPLGGTAVLSVSVSASPKAVVQWKRNGAVIPGATNRSLTLSNFHLELAGTYHLSATNVLGAVLSAPAELRPDSPPRLSQSRPSANGNITVTVAGTAGQTYVIEASTNLMLWLPIGTNTPPSGIWEYAEVISTDLPCRYFRARPLP